MRFWKANLRKRIKNLLANLFQINELHHEAHFIVINKAIFSVITSTSSESVLIIALVMHQKNPSWVMILRQLLFNFKYRVSFSRRLTTPDSSEDSRANRQFKKHFPWK